LAGVPNEVVKRARAILAEMTEGAEPKSHASRMQESIPMEMSIEDVSIYEAADRIKKVDINTLTPIEAMNFIFELKKLF
jgi:DNA mismatch repair protein MutS